MKRRICIVTGARSDYGLFRPLLRRLHADPKCELQIVATGMHLSDLYGRTEREIESDGFTISARVDIDLKENSPLAVARSMGLAIQGLSDAVEKLKPEIVVLLGDRFETFAAASAATVLKIPIAHLHGGEITEGAIDDPFRHSITKMSYWHFTSHETHRTRVIQLGEAPNRVFNVGAMGVDEILSFKPLDRAALEKDLGFSLRKPLFIVTFHPVTQESQTAEKQFSSLLSALDQFPEASVVFTKPNADPEGRVIISKIEEWVSRNSARSKSFDSLGSKRYLSLLKLADAVIGNSSSALIEAPYFRTASIDIGDRQRGRLRPESVIHVAPETEEITVAIRTGLSSQFRDRLSKMALPFGEGGAAEKVAHHVLTAELPKDLKKSFFDLK